MRVLVACEESGTVRDAFRKLGHDAYSCDILPNEYYVILLAYFKKENLKVTITKTEVPTH